MAPFSLSMEPPQNPGRFTPEQDQQCQQNPNSAACASLGDPTNDKPQTSTQGVTFTPVAFAGGSCPADIVFTAMGNSYTLSMQPLCDGASNYVKPVLLVVAVALGAMIFIGGLKA